MCYDIYIMCNAVRYAASVLLCVETLALASVLCWATCTLRTSGPGYKTHR